MNSRTIDRNRMALWLLAGLALLSAAAVMVHPAPVDTNAAGSAALAALESAAASGDAKAQSRLGDVYAGQLDSVTAIVWYRQAAEQGEPHAQWQLGRYHEFGGGNLPVDAKAAAHWYEKAAAQGYSNAQMDLAQICEKGTAGKLDSIEAYKWYTLAANDRCLLALPSRDRLALKMDAQEILEGQQRVESFMLKEETARVRATAVSSINEQKSAALSPSPNLRAERPPVPSAVSATASRSKTAPRLPAETQPVPPPDPAAVSKLQLRGISAFGSRRAATVNQRNLLEGEEAELSIDGQRVRLRCVQITESSATLQIQGLSQLCELNLVR